MIGKIILFVGIFLFTCGCSNIMSMGKNQTYCEEHGFDYSDAGLCGDPMQIYKNRHKIIRQINGGM